MVLPRKTQTSFVTKTTGQYTVAIRRAIIDKIPEISQDIFIINLPKQWQLPNL